MRIEVEDLTTVEKILRVEVPREVVDSVIQEVIRDLRKKAKVKGFREGKVPDYLVRKLFREEIEEKSVEKILDKTLYEAIKEAKLEPLLRPKIEELGELKEGEKFVYSVLVEIRPEFELKREDYVGVEVEKEKDEVKEEDVDRLVQEIRYSFSELKKIDEEVPIAERDVVVLKFEAYDENGLIPGHQAEALFVDVGTGEFNKEIEDALIGRKVKERFSIEVEYPQDGLNPLLAGKKVRYDLDIKEVYRRKLEELTDEFLQRLNLGFESIEALRNSIRNRLLEETKRRNESLLKERILDKILEKVKIDVPHRYVEFKLHQLIDQVRQTLERDGFSFESLNISTDKLRERLRPIAEKQAKEEILLEKIAELENIEIPQEEIDRTVESIAKGLNISVEQARHIVYFNILPKKLAENTLRFLIENAKIIEKES